MRVRVGKWGVAFGIDWTLPNNAAEVRQLRKEHASRAYVLTQLDRQQHWLGFHEPVKGETYSAALLVGMLKPNAVILYPLSEDHAWVCVLMDGMPQVGHDQVVPLEEGVITARKWSTMYTKAEMIGDFTGATNNFEGILAQLEEGLANKSIRKKQLAPARLHANGAVARKVAVGVLAAATVLGAVVAFRTYQANQRLAEKDRLTALQKAQEVMHALQMKAKREGDARAQMEAYQKQVAALREQQASRVDPVVFWQAASQVRRSLPLSSHGYKPQDTECTTQACRVGWIGNGTFVSVGDKLLLPNVEVSYTQDRRASSVFPLSLATSSMPALPAGIASPEQLQFWLTNAFTTHYAAMLFEPAQPIDVPVPKESGIAQASVASVGKWHVSFASGGLLEAASLAQALTRWPVRITGIKFANGTVVELTGEYVFVGG